MSIMSIMYNQIKYVSMKKCWQRPLASYHENYSS